MDAGLSAGVTAASGFRRGAADTVECRPAVGRWPGRDRSARGPARARFDAGAYWPAQWAYWPAQFVIAGPGGPGPSLAGKRSGGTDLPMPRSGSRWRGRRPRVA